MFIFVSRFLLPKGYRGITLFPFVILRDAADKNDLVLLNHERIHIRQQMELVVLPFYVIYAFDFIVKLIYYRSWKKAYYNIAFEREAYSNEADMTYLVNRRFWNFRTYFFG